MIYQFTRRIGWFLYRYPRNNGVVNIKSLRKRFSIEEYLETEILKMDKK